MAEGGGLTIDRATLAALKRASESIGNDRFYHLLLDVVRGCLPNDSAAIVRYSRYAPPELLLGSDYDSNFVFLYTHDLYRHDPFDRYWKAGGAPGIVSLNEAVTTDADHLNYVSTILAALRVTDEIGIFLPLERGNSLVFFLDRRGGSYSRAEIERADQVYELIVGLHTAHRNAAGAAPEAGSSPGPLAIPDTISRLLSQREVGIVDLMLQGYPTKKIAERLGLTLGTVKNYRRRIYDKLDVTTEREVFLSCVAEPGQVAVF